MNNKLVCIKCLYNIYLPKLSRWQKLVGPFFNISNRYIKSWGNDTTLIQTTSQVDNNFTSSMVINYFKFANVSYKCELF